MMFPWKFQRYLSIAERFLRRGRLPALLLAVARKNGRHDRQLSAVREDLLLLRTLAGAWWRGEYRAVSSQALVAVVAALVYFLSPVDAIPDVLLGVGYLDDIAVIAWLMRTWRSELDSFRVWRDAQPPALREVLALPPPTPERPR